MSNEHFQNLVAFQHQRSDRFYLRTGCSALDSLLKGGFPSRSIVELFGAANTGKSQLLHSLVVISQFPKHLGGGEGKAIFIDTEGTFRPERISEICENYRIDPSIVLDNIIYARAYTADHQLALLEQCLQILTSDTIVLIVIDSLSALFRTINDSSDFSTEIRGRQFKLGQFLKRLSDLVSDYNIVAVYSNEVRASLNESESEIKKVHHFGGNVVAHLGDLRCYLYKNSIGKRFVHVFQSNYVAEATVAFKICSSGICDEDKLTS
ncbi:hypothetical protein RCL1_006851 [Eukaryota sp. TZLM3-RCL]